MLNLERESEIEPGLPLPVGLSRRVCRETDSNRHWTPEFSFGFSVSLRS